MTKALHGYTSPFSALWARTDVPAEPPPPPPPTHTHTPPPSLIGPGSHRGENKLYCMYLNLVIVGIFQLIYIALLKTN